MPPLVRTIAPSRRMALTNYLGATAAIWLLMPLRPLLGLDTATASTWTHAMGLCAAILTAQWIFSTWWLKQHSHGPLEKVWRTITWGHHRADIPNTSTPRMNVKYIDTQHKSATITQN
ncbi:DUF418 domain-containing protein [Rhodococcus sp. NPDC055024]